MSEILVIMVKLDGKDTHYPAVDREFSDNPGPGETIPDVVQKADLAKQDGESGAVGLNSEIESRKMAAIFM